MKTGGLLEPLDSPSPINKSFAMIMACAVNSELLEKVDAPLAGRLRQKVNKSLDTMLPGQEPDCFWIYKF